MPKLNLAEASNQVQQLISDAVTDYAKAHADKRYRKSHEIVRRFELNFGFETQPYVHVHCCSRQQPNHGEYSNLSVGMLELPEWDEIAHQAEEGKRVEIVSADGSTIITSTWMDFGVVIGEFLCAELQRALDSGKMRTLPSAKDCIFDVRSHDPYFRKYEAVNERDRFFSSAAANPAEFVEEYERLLERIRNSDQAIQEKLLCEYGNPTATHFNEYVESVMKATRRDHSAALIHAYELVLSTARCVEATLFEKVFACTKVLGEHFTEYTKAIASRGRNQDVRRMITFFERYWTNFLGFSYLVDAAVGIAEFELAAKYCVWIRSNAKYYFRGDSMSKLALIWHRAGRQTEARDLLIDCIEKLLDEQDEMNASGFEKDRENWRSNMREHVRTFLQLFDSDQMALRKLGVPNQFLTAQN